MSKFQDLRIKEVKVHRTVLKMKGNKAEEITSQQNIETKQPAALERMT